eukprot:TRINITY_DN30496_c0_g1_i1.p1 TRINITY_DN30496_c0_g1~~TRINITY_DN30496_c0_g1_i1.p1  ORF type:complete len:425 (+),score=174.14 TRINITY_DN30496_c0_g1_i1:57-1331(+)
MLSDVQTAGRGLWVYYRVMSLMVWARGSHDYQEVKGLCRGATGSDTDDLFAATFLQTVGLMFRLFNEPHYRTDSLQQDLLDNFRNVCIPGTGIAISVLCIRLWVLVAYFLLLHPLVIAVASYNISKSEAHSKGRSLASIFRDELICPGHWFALWRMNSVLVAAHHAAHRDNKPVARQYDYENKWEFLKAALEKRRDPAFGTLGVTPILETPIEIVCKHKNIEGGMGVHVFKNAAAGGDWILQKRLYNSAELQALLPDDAPLSTYRVITMVDPLAETEADRFVVITVVFRAGRKGKSTDHSSVLLPVSMTGSSVGEILPGKSFHNWYGVGEPGRAVLSGHGLTTHPDTGKRLAGCVLKSAETASEMCLQGHRKLLTDVPVCGWDVAVTDTDGPVLLEANLSCNLFGGQYDKERFAGIVDTYLKKL